MTTKIVEGQYRGEFLLSEVSPGKVSRDNATVTVRLDKPVALDRSPMASPNSMASLANSTKP